MCKVHHNQRVVQYLPDHFFFKCKFYQQKGEPNAVISRGESRKVNKPKISLLPTINTHSRSQMLINKSFYLGPLFAGLAHVCFNKRCRSQATKPIPSEEPKVTDRTDTWLGWTLGSFLLKQTHPSFQVLAHDTKEQRWGGRVISFTWMANM